MVVVVVVSVEVVTQKYMTVPADEPSYSVNHIITPVGPDGTYCGVYAALNVVAETIKMSIVAKSVPH